MMIGSHSNLIHLNGKMPSTNKRGNAMKLIVFIPFLIHKDTIIIPVSTYTYITNFRVPLTSDSPGVSATCCRNPTSTHPGATDKRLLSLTRVFLQLIRVPRAPDSSLCGVNQSLTGNGYLLSGQDATVLWCPFTLNQSPCKDKRRPPLCRSKRVPPT